MNLTVQNSTFRNNRANHFDSGATGLSTMDIVLNGNTFVTDGGYTTLGGAINITNDHQSDVTFDVNGNSFNGALLSAVNFFTSNATTSAASMIGKFRNNAIGTAGVTNSASSTGNGFQVTATGGGAVTMNITGNAIRNWGSNYGIDVAAGDVESECAPPDEQPARRALQSGDDGGGGGDGVCGCGRGWGTGEHRDECGACDRVRNPGAAAEFIDSSATGFFDGDSGNVPVWTEHGVERGGSDNRGDVQRRGGLHAGAVVILVVCR
jgi:hypothetical protein